MDSCAHPYMRFVQLRSEFWKSPKSWNGSAALFSISETQVLEDSLFQGNAPLVRSPNSMSGAPVLRLVCLAANMRCLKGAVGGAGNLTHPNTPAHTDTDTQKTGDKVERER